MAFIPDEVLPLQKKRKLSPNARLVYNAHCKFRQHAYRVSFATNEEIAEFCEISLGSVRNATTELVADGWILKRGHWTEFLIGNFYPVDKNHPLKEIPAGPLFAQTRRPTAVRNHQTVIPNHDSMSGDHETMITNHETVISDHDSVSDDHETVIAHIEDRARGSQPDQPDQPHTPAARPRAREEEWECVCGLRYTWELLSRFASVKGLGEGWLNKAFDGCSNHGGVRVWLEEEASPDTPPSPLLDARDCPDCAGGGYYYPDGPARGVKKCPHVGLYARLAARAEVEATAHAPPAAQVA